MTAPLTLALDASTYTGSVALLRGAEPVVEREVAMRGEREERMMPTVAEVFASAGATPAELARVVCGAGPGSFTSLRIAAAIAKGLASARGVPLFAVPSLALIVAGNSVADGRYLAVLDAMRGDAYVAGYAVAAGAITEIVPLSVVARPDVEAMATRLGAQVVGPAETPAAWPRASGIRWLGAWIEGAVPVDLAAWEPTYGRVAEAQARWERAHGRPLAGA